MTRGPMAMCCLSLHGSPDSVRGGDSQGCIGFSNRDAEDIHSILSEGSKVVLRR